MDHGTQALSAASPGRRVRLYVAGWVAVAAVAVVATVAASPEAPTGAVSGPAAVLSLGLWGLIASVVMVPAPRGNTVEGLKLDEAGHLPIVLLLPVPLVLLVSGVATLVAEAVLTRGRLDRLAFNLAWQVAGVVAAWWTYAGLVDEAFSGDVATVAAALAAGSAYVLVNLVAFSGLVAVRERRPWSTTLAEGAASDLAISYGTAATGVLIAVLIVRAPAGLVLLAIPTLFQLARMRWRGDERARALVERTRFERAIESTSDAVVLLDARGCIEVWNAEAVAITGVPATQAVGTTLSDLGLDDLSDVAERGPAAEQIDIAGRTLDVRIAMVEGFGRVAGGRVLSLRDVTREVEIARIRDDLVSRVSHEIRTPLVSVGGFLQTLEARWDRLTEDQRTEMLGVARRGAERLMLLVSNLMQWARIEDRATPAPAAAGSGRGAEVAPVVNEVVSSLAGEVRTAVDDVGAVPMAPEDLRTVVLNLSTNALTYGRPPVGVAVRLVGEDVELVVSDHGAGLPPGARTEVFEPFWQASSGTRRTARGLGMGLAVVRVLVEDAGGSVSYRDGPDGRGAEFVVRLPRSTPSTSEEPPEVT